MRGILAWMDAYGNDRGNELEKIRRAIQEKRERKQLLRKAVLIALYQQFGYRGSL